MNISVNMLASIAPNPGSVPVHCKYMIILRDVGNLPSKNTFYSLSNHSEANHTLDI